MSGENLRSGWRGAVWSLLERYLFDVRSEEGQFNPYLEWNRDLDVAQAPRLRRRNLERYLGSISTAPEVVVVAEAPGPWGCRFSGVPITSEAQLVDVSFPIHGVRTSLRREAYSEYSAGIFWRVMRVCFPRFIVWNAFPLHPFRVGLPMTIRTPRVGELRAFAGLTAAIIAEVEPLVVVALGRKAELQLSWCGIESVYVRHPSQGGAKLFEEGMQSVFESLGGSARV